ncbi:MAG: CDP-alcohol phosphatidyltransferase family protein [Phycisphaerae bacterium]
MIGRAVGWGFSTARDAIARGLVRVKVTPNALSALGIVITTAAGICYAIGSFWFIMLAGALLIFSAACDMLDGAVARLGNMTSRFGAFLDSTLDRYSDFAIYAGIAVYYASREVPNVTFILLSMLAFFNAFMISYTRARAEDIIEKCRVGYWQRGERFAAVLIGTFAFNISALVVQQAISPAFTWIRRMRHTKAIIDGKNPITDPRKGGWWMKIRPWLWPRMTIPYDIITGLNILWLMFAPVPEIDPLRDWLAMV